MWERDLKNFADDYNFVSLQFDNESVDSTVADGVDVAKVCILCYVMLCYVMLCCII